MKLKLSQYLVEKGDYPTRSQAHNAIKEGRIRVNGLVIRKDGYLVDESDLILTDKPQNHYVSRGGYKLEAALRSFNISLENKVVLDIGASTGGFSDCCLQHGARRVYCYDVGHGQLADSLKLDPRIVQKEGINARYLSRSDFSEEIDFICMDVSFISCTKIFESIADILAAGSTAVILYKPQFEVGTAYLNRKGVAVDRQAISNSLIDCQKAADKLELTVEGLIPSPLRGQDGNQEYLMLLRKNGKDPIVIEEI